MMREVDVLLIGQGICGTFLGNYLEKKGVSFLMIDASKPDTASKSASGLINPVTGRRFVKTWMIDELLPMVWDCYQALGKELNTPCIAQKNILDFFPSPQMREAFLKRYQEDPQYVSLPSDENSWRDSFNYDFGFGIVSPCYVVDMAALLKAYREKIQRQGLLEEGHFEIGDLQIQPNKIVYKNIQADKIIFCDGVAGDANPYFQRLPFAPNKGEALIIEADIPEGSIYKKGLGIVPLGKNLFWVGASYEWDFTDPGPTEAFLQKTSALLSGWLKTNFEIKSHLASIRPATLERRPFVGFHPHQPRVGILNGMGSKGCSLAPYFAQQLANHIASGSDISPEADIRRFQKILGR